MKKAVPKKKAARKKATRKRPTASPAPKKAKKKAAAKKTAAPKKKAKKKISEAAKAAARKRPRRTAKKKSPQTTAAVALRRLERQAEVLRLQAAGYSYREIAALLGCSKTTVETDITRAVERDTGKIIELRYTILGEHLNVLGEQLPKAIRLFGGEEGQDIKGSAMVALLTHSARISDLPALHDMEDNSLDAAKDAQSLKTIAGEIPRALVRMQKTIKRSMGMPD